jgi:hypothetical protein
MTGMNWRFRWKYLNVDTIILMVVIKHLNLDNKFIYYTVTLNMFQFVSCVGNVQITAGVELLQHINISFLWFLVDVEVLG